MLFLEKQRPLDLGICCLSGVGSFEQDKGLVRVLSWESPELPLVWDGLDRWLQGDWAGGQGKERGTSCTQV